MLYVLYILSILTMCPHFPICNISGKHTTEIAALAIQQTEVEHRIADLEDADIITFAGNIAYIGLKFMVNANKEDTFLVVGR